MDNDLGRFDSPIACSHGPTQFSNLQLVHRAAAASGYGESRFCDVEPAHGYDERNAIATFSEAISRPAESTLADRLSHTQITWLVTERGRTTGLKPHERAAQSCGIECNSHLILPLTQVRPTFVVDRHNVSRVKRMYCQDCFCCGHREMVPTLCRGSFSLIALPDRISGASRVEVTIAEEPKLANFDEQSRTGDVGQNRART